MPITEATLNELVELRRKISLGKEFEQYLALGRELHGLHVRWGRAEKAGKMRFVHSIELRISVLVGLISAYTLFLFKKFQQIEDIEEQY
jgi:hypothetical protein